jgi:hypothetical protein
MTRGAVTITHHGEGQSDERCKENLRLMMRVGCGRGVGGDCRWDGWAKEGGGGVEELEARVSGERSEEAGRPSNRNGSGHVLWRRQHLLRLDASSAE